MGDAHCTHFLTQVWIVLLDCDRDVVCVLVLGFDRNVFEDVVTAREHPFQLEEHHTCLYSFSVLTR